MSERQVTFVLADDWVRMYINNTLVEEGHRLPQRVVAELLVGKENVHTVDFLDLPDHIDWEATYLEAGGLDLDDVMALYERAMHGSTTALPQEADCQPAH